VRRDALLRRLVDLQYERKTSTFTRPFRVRGDIVEVFPSFDRDRASASVLRRRK